MDDRVRAIQDQLTTILRHEAPDQLRTAVELVHPSDLAEVIQRLDHEQALEILQRAPRAHRLKTVESMPASAANRILDQFDNEQLADLLRRLDPDDAADIFLQFPTERQEAVLPLIGDDEKRKQLIDLISYPPDSAGGVMTTEFLTVDESVTAEQAIEAAREASTETETIYYIYTTDETNCLSGALSMRELLQSDPERPVNDFVQRDLVKVRVDDDQEQAAKLMERYQLLAIPVVDEWDRVRGIITIDDAVNVLEDETTEDFYKQSGMSSVEALETERSNRVINATVWTNLLIRMPWLFVVALGGLGAGAVIGVFETTLKETVTLAFFLPLLMDMGGNVGTQSTTIFVRGMVLGQIEPRSFMKYLLYELTRTGLAIGSIFGVLVFGAAYFMQIVVRGQGSGLAVKFGLIVGISMFLIVVLASLIGYMIPWLAHLMGWDPAAASNPVVTTIKDITGVVIYFTIASLFL